MWRARAFEGSTVMKHKCVTAITTARQCAAQKARLIQAGLGLALLASLPACDSAEFLASQTAQDCKADGKVEGGGEGCIAPAWSNMGTRARPRSRTRRASWTR